MCAGYQAGLVNLSQRRTDLLCSGATILAVIHVTAVIGPGTELADAEVGPFAIVGVDGPDAPLVVGAAAVIRSHAVIYRGTTIGQRFHAGHGALVRNGCVIGDDVSIGSHAVVEFDVTIEDGVRLHSRAFVPEHSILRRGAWIGPGVIVTNSRHPLSASAKADLQGVTVGEGAMIGAGAVLLPGITIGAGATVGAGAVVVVDVDPGSTVVGNPARALGRG